MTDPGTATPSCIGTGAWVNRSIAGTGIAPRTFVTSVSASPACVVTLNQAVVAPGITGGSTLLKIDNSNVRSVADGSYGVAVTVIASPSGNCTGTTDNGLSVSGTDIPPGTTVVSCNGTGWNISLATTNAGCRGTLSSRSAAPSSRPTPVR